MPSSYQTPVPRAFALALIGLCSGTLIAPRAIAEVSVWGGGTGYSDLPANWVGGVLPPPENTIAVNAGKMSGRGLTAALINVAAGAEVYVLAEGGSGLILNSPSSLDSQTIAGGFFIGIATSPGHLTVNGGSYFTGGGSFRMTNPLSLIDGPGQFIMGQGLNLSGQGTIASGFYANGLVSANIPGGTLVIASPTIVTMTHGLAINGGTLRIEAPAVEGITTLEPDLELITSPTLWEAKPNSEIVISANTNLVKPIFIDGGGTVTHEGAPLIVNAGYSGDFTLRHPITIGDTLDLRALGGRPAGKLTFARAPDEPSGIWINNDYDYSDGTGIADGPSRILGGEVLLQDTDSFMTPSGSFLSDTGSLGVRLEQATVRGRGELYTGFYLAFYESSIEADNPAGAPLTIESEPERLLRLNYFNLPSVEVHNAGKLAASNGGILVLDGRTITNYSDGGTFPNGFPHGRGRLEASTGGRIQVNGGSLTAGSIFVSDAASKFVCYAESLSGGTGDSFVEFFGPGRFEIVSRLLGQLIVVPGTVVSFPDPGFGFGASTIDGNVFFNGSGTYRLEGGSILPANESGDTLTINGTLGGAGYIQNVPVYVGRSGRVSAERYSGFQLQILCPVFNGGRIIAAAGDTSLRIEAGYTVENIPSAEHPGSGEMLLQGPVDLLGRIKGGQIECASTLYSGGGTLEDVTITQLVNPSNVDVSAASSLILKGTIHNNGVIRAPEGSTLILDGSVEAKNHDGRAGRIELSPAASIDDIEDRAPTLILGPRQTLLARRFEGQEGMPMDFRANVWVPLENQGTVVADGMVLYLDRNPTGNGRFAAINGGVIDNLTWEQRAGEVLKLTLEAVGGFIKLNAPNGLDATDTKLAARLPEGQIHVQSPTHGPVNVRNTNVSAQNGAAVVSHGGGFLVGLNGSNVVANGANNVINGNGSTIAVLDGGKFIANGSGNATGVPGRGAAPRGAKNAETAGLTRVLIGDGGTISAAAIEIQNDALLQITPADPNADPENFVLPPDTISYGNIEGTFDLHAGGAWAADIGGTVTGQTYDQLVVTGAAQLAGALRIRILNGFQQTIQPSDTFTILTATAGITGLPTNSENGRIPTRDLWGTFAIAVSPDGMGLVLSDFQSLPHPLFAWAESYGLMGADTLMTADPDHDGRTNLEEFAYLTSPTDGGDVPGMTVDRNGDVLIVSITRRIGETHRLAYDPETSASMASWLPLAAPWTHECAQVTPETETVTITGATADLRRYFRMRVTAQ